MAITTLLATAISAALAMYPNPEGGQRSSPARNGDVPEVTRPDPERSGGANVIEVIDGDSLVLLLDGQIYRFEVLGADTPEWVEKAEVPSPESVEAKRFLTRMLYGEQVTVFEPVPGATDAIGRRRGYIFREPDGLFVDLEIVRQGYGKVSTRAAAPYERVLRWYEQRARELGRGVWGRPESPEIAAEPAGPEIPTTPEPQPAEDMKPHETPPKSAESWVWVTKSGSKYHRESCQHAGSTSTRILRVDAEKTYQPCRVCRPDED
ncbi:MAG: hypothetical protein D6692_02090 [Planctomycetota bacterium]|nr:MAG: hypothetical protein D6692_02090 [Planctomycetota bacterium]